MRGAGRSILRSLAVLATAAWAFVLAATAQVPAQPGPPEIPDEVVGKMITLGLRNIQRGLCGGLNGCAPATPEEYQLPPITLGMARIAMLTGAQSAVARWCGLDAQRRSVGPTMRIVRQKFKLDERQMALIAIIHNIQQTVVAEQIKAKGRDCNATTRSKLDAELPKG
jgi:hypothetical protein